MQNVPFVRSPYNYDLDAASDEAGLACLDTSLTQQNFKSDCDINVIMRKYSNLHEIPAGVQIPQYADFDQIYDFHSAANAVARARESFDMLPAPVRSRFQNDPGAFVDFALEPKNFDALCDMGLAKKPLNLDPGPPSPNPAPAPAPAPASKSGA